LGPFILFQKKVLFISPLSFKKTVGGYIAASRKD
jgi:hypothetical protein